MCQKKKKTSRIQSKRSFDIEFFILYCERIILFRRIHRGMDIYISRPFFLVTLKKYKFWLLHIYIYLNYNISAQMNDFEKNYW